MRASKTVEEIKRGDLSSLVRDFLGEDYLSLSVKKMTLIENYDKEESQINCRISENGGKGFSIKSSGHGVLDALFGGLLSHYREGFLSLENISFEGFKVKPDFTKGSNSGSDAEVEVTIKFRNSAKGVVTFRSIGRSFVSASVRAVVSAVEFYINSEKCFLRLRELIEEAKSRGRTDIAQGYISKLTKVVEATSYEQLAQ